MINALPAAMPDYNQGIDSEASMYVDHAINSTSSFLPSSLSTIITEGGSLKSRGVEEDHVNILHRNGSLSSKSSNSRYQCKYCGFEFVGGPQKIRVHLTGNKENGTRLSKCEKVPDAVRELMETRKKSPKFFPPPDEGFTSLPQRSMEEKHCMILERSPNMSARSSNTKYKCNYCYFQFVGGPQKIRVHLTGMPEGGTRVTKCTQVPEEVVEMMLARRKACKKSDHSTPSGHHHYHSGTSLLPPSQLPLPSSIQSHQMLPPQHILAHHLHQAHQHNQHQQHHHFQHHHRHHHPIPEIKSLSEAIGNFPGQNMDLVAHNIEQISESALSMLEAADV